MKRRLLLGYALAMVALLIVQNLTIAISARGVPGFWQVGILRTMLIFAGLRTGLLLAIGWAVLMYRSRLRLGLLAAVVLYAFPFGPLIERIVFDLPTELPLLGLDAVMSYAAAAALIYLAATATESDGTSRDISRPT